MFLLVLKETAETKITYSPKVGYQEYNKRYNISLPISVREARNKII